jgi:hypothetical protein
MTEESNSIDILITRLRELKNKMKSTHQEWYEAFNFDAYHSHENPRPPSTTHAKAIIMNKA